MTIYSRAISEIFSYAFTLDLDTRIFISFISQLPVLLEKRSYYRVLIS
jgi:hypothetical protein